MGNKLFVRLASLAINILYCGLANAGTVVDQEFSPGSSPGMYSGVGSADFAQTFTVARSGVIQSVEVDIEKVAGNQDSLQFDIRRTLNGVPLENDADVLYSETIDASRVPSARSLFRVLVEGANIKVSAGETLAIVLRSRGWLLDRSSDYWWLGRTWSNTRPDQYRSGDAYVRASFRSDLTYSNSGSWGHVNIFSDNTRGAGDLGFRVNLTVENILPSVSIVSGSRTVQDTDQLPGEAVLLTGTAADVDGTIASRRWLVDGNVVATSSSPSLSLKDGANLVTFEATDNNGAISSATATIFVAAPVIKNKPPALSINGGSRTVADSDNVTGEAVFFTGTALDIDGRIVSEQWTVNGNVVANGEQASLKLLDGLNAVTFKATDDDGAVSSVSVTISVKSPLENDTLWLGTYNSIAAPPAYEIGFNSIGKVNPARGLLHSCVRVLENGIPSSLNGMTQIDVTFGIVSLDSGIIRLIGAREFSAQSRALEAGGGPLLDCSGAFESTQGEYRDVIQLGTQIFNVIFKLTNQANLEFELAQGLLLQAK